MLAVIDPASAILQVGFAAVMVVIVRPVFRPEVRRDAPVEVFALLWFSLAVVLVDWCGRDFALWPSGSALRQYCGQSPSMTYSFCAIGSAFLLAERKNRSRYALVAILGIGAIYSVSDDLGPASPSDVASPYRPIWTVGIPLIWMVVLLSPRVNRHCSGTTAVAV